MTEHRVELKTFLIKFKCDNCDEGYLGNIPGAAFLSSPPMHPHRCSHCSFTTHIRGGKRYPILETVEVRQD